MDDDRPGPTEVERPGHSVWDLGAGWRITEPLELRVLGRNLTDRRYRDSAGRGGPAGAGAELLGGAGGAVLGTTGLRPAPHPCPFSRRPPTGREKGTYEAAELCRVRCAHQKRWSWCARAPYVTRLPSRRVPFSRSGGGRWERGVRGQAGPPAAAAPRTRSPSPARRSGPRRGRRASRPGSHQGEADAEAGPGAVEAPARPGRRGRRRAGAGPAAMPMPSSRDLHHGILAVLALDRELRSGLAGVGELGGVAQQVRDHLLQPGRRRRRAAERPGGQLQLAAAAPWPRPGAARSRRRAAPPPRGRAARAAAPSCRG